MLCCGFTQVSKEMPGMSGNRMTASRLGQGDAEARDIGAIAAEAFAVLGTERQIQPFSSRYREFSLSDAYHVAAAVRTEREHRGERVVGRKIGFTNRTIWPEYNVHQPIWGYLYDRTVFDLGTVGAGFSLQGLAEPRIEPEVVFGLREAPDPAMDNDALLDCIEWVAHGFEIVQSIFPAWTFTAPDTVAAYGLHGALLVGPHHQVAGRRTEWQCTLSSFDITLSRDGEVMDRGLASNVLDGPVSALRHLVALLATGELGPQLTAGEIVTTGTLTRALPVAPGETWTTRLSGVALPNARIRFA